MDRDETIKLIRTALKRRSGKTWSVTGGRGTAWGWLEIDAPPSKRTEKSRPKADNPSEYEYYDSGTPGGHMTKTCRDELAKLLGLETVHIQGVSIPASNQYYQEYIDRAEGRTPSIIGRQYWD